MPSAGDALLFAISARRRLSWGSFSEILDAVFVPDDTAGSDVRQVRSTVASLGSALGHWDVVSDGQSARVYIAPPSLVRLPWPGLPRAVLCGSRSPDTLHELSRACIAAGATVHPSSQNHLNRYAPTRLEVTARSPADLARVAASLGLRHQPQPVAEALTDLSGSITGYVASLEWVTEPDIDWIRRDFDPEELRLVHTASDAPRSQQLSLTVYENRAGWARQDRLWRGSSWARADRDWGRYAVLAARGRAVANYERSSGAFTVPRQVPLPAAPARALGLCSGKPPRIGTHEGLGTYSYLDVPVSVGSELLRKLEQDRRVPPNEQTGSDE